MATYVISDIHGQYDMFMELLEKIKLKDTDLLFVLGDVLDRGPHPIKTLRKLMVMPNAICLLGNHEYMARECLEDFMMRKVTSEAIEELESITEPDKSIVGNWTTWMLNGGESTTAEFRQLDPEARQDVLDFLRDLGLYDEISVNGKDYLMVHAGIANYSPEKDMNDYQPEELVMTRADYDVPYYDYTYIITGHIPTQIIEDNPRPGYINRRNNHIAIDCGAHIPGGRLAALCLDTGEEFYSGTYEPEGKRSN